MGIMQKKVETTTMGLGFRIPGLGSNESIIGIWGFPKELCRGYIGFRV